VQEIQCAFCECRNPIDAKACKSCNAPFHLAPCPFCAAVNRISDTVCYKCHAGLDQRTIKIFNSPAEEAEHEKTIPNFASQMSVTAVASQVVPSEVMRSTPTPIVAPFAATDSPRAPALPPTTPPPAEPLHRAPPPANRTFVIAASAAAVFIAAALAFVALFPWRAPYAPPTVAAQTDPAPTSSASGTITQAPTSSAPVVESAETKVATVAAAKPAELKSAPPPASPKAVVEKKSVPPAGAANPRETRAENAMPRKTDVKSAETKVATVAAAKPAELKSAPPPASPKAVVEKKSVPPAGAANPRETRAENAMPRKTDDVIRGLASVDREKIQRVIAQQIRAFSANDEAGAFSYASPVMRRQFGSPQNFMNMVRTGYPALINPQSQQFLEPIIVKGVTLQPVRLTTSSGETVIARYTMEQQPDRDWRIDGCDVSPAKNVTPSRADNMLKRGGDGNGAVQSTKPATECTEAVAALGLCPANAK
jgi:hypothetical protein